MLRGDRALKDPLVLGAKRVNGLKKTSFATLYTIPSLSISRSLVLGNHSTGHGSPTSCPTFAGNHRILCRECAMETRPHWNLCGKWRNFWLNYFELINNNEDSDLQKNWRYEATHIEIWTKNGGMNRNNNGDVTQQPEVCYPATMEIFSSIIFVQKGLHYIGGRLFYGRQWSKIIQIFTSGYLT